MKLSNITPASIKSSLFFICVLLCTQFSSAQVSTSSPYSRYGIGDLASSALTRNMGMGGTEFALSSPFFINAGNPASYSDLFYTTFDIGVKFNQYELKTNSVTQNTNNTSLSYFQFAFPIKPLNWSLGFGLQPYSNVGYSIIENTLTPTGEAEKRSYKGSGGLNSFHFGSGKKIGKKLSVGLNVEYLFGVIDQYKSIEFASAYYMNALDNRSTAIGWFHFKFGLQYNSDSLRFAKSDSLTMLDNKIGVLTDSLNRILSNPAAANYEDKNLLNQEIAQAKDIRSKVVERKKKSDWKYTIGLVGSPTASLNARESRVASSYRFYNYADPTQILIRDTALYTYGDKKKVNLPMSIGLGFAFKKGTKWTIAGDYSMQQWSDFSYLGDKDSLFNSWKATAGIQYIPNDRANRGYTKFVSYRLGFHYEQTFLNVGSEKINDMGVSIGLGLPIGKTATNVHLSLEAGKRGNVSFNPIEEKYIKFAVGITINDRWFVKPKYD
jgi:hypothetical protein